LEFGKRFFSYLGEKLCTKLETKQCVIVACAVLHNIARRMNEVLEEAEEAISLELEDEDNLISSQ
jgi:hypothetical protein